MALQFFVWALAAFSVSRSFTQTVWLLGRGISPSQNLYLYTKQHKHRINAHNTDIHALNGIRTHVPSVRASEDSLYLTPRGHCDRRRLERLWNQFSRIKCDIVRHDFVGGPPTYNFIKITSMTFEINTVTQNGIAPVSYLGTRTTCAHWE
jgi:hypothetical protein